MPHSTEANISIIFDILNFWFSGAALYSSEKFIIFLLLFQKSKTRQADKKSLFFYYMNRPMKLGGQFRHSINSNNLRVGVLIFKIILLHL